MIERTPALNIATHAILFLGLALLLFPMYLVFVAASQTLQDVNSIPAKLWFGDQFWVNLQEAWISRDFRTKFVNSLIVATGVVVGKIVIAAMTAFGIVFFNHRLRMPIFWAVFITLMLPLEVRIVPTYAVAANALTPFQTILDASGLSWLLEKASGIEVALEWNLLNSYTGLILPLVATATGTFLYRQFFLTIPDELVEAAKMDGAGPLRFLRDILIPLSVTNMAALATIMFVVGWNQYLWPLLITTDPNYGVVAVELGRLVPDENTTGGDIPQWHVAMAGTLIVMIPPILVVILMQRWFVRGLISTEK
ncbi:Glycerol-3-phosphate ABC transporter, permease protein UgpE [Rhodovulum sp. P5]|uniref:ABC transporter permease subunit n=1 Tax=Rhodovulum sp. P5 TaxID=1564506 RepID=UPI0009C2EBB7|nr:ABC transporter permease subunit [Rhodovulum sp. P5]ARE39022.1 Glycerol-3-phosphate ABC transporter, permease protein UgpE [Rhodovulum sp. P5]